MAQIILPNQWTSQPQVPAGVNDPVVSASLPIGGLEWVTTGAGVWVPQNTASLSSSACAAGRSLLNSSTGYWSRTSPLTTIGPITVGIVYTPTTVTGDEGIWSAATSNVSSNPKYLIQRNGANIRVYSAASYRVTFSNVAVIGKPLFIVFTQTINGDNYVGASCGLAVNGNVGYSSGTFTNGSGGSTEYLGSGYNGQSDGHYSLYFYGNFSASTKQLSELSTNPWQIFRPITRRIYVDIPAATGDVTITATIGDALAEGIAATVTTTGSGTSVDCSVGNATAAGLSAYLDRAIAASVGDAAAAGTSASLDLQISATVGNATAAGTTASRELRIECTVANATAAGIAASLSGASTIATVTGDALADGIQSLVGTNITINTTVGNALAAGMQAGVELLQRIDAAVGNAIANGEQAAIDAANLIDTVVANAIATGTTASISTNVPLTDSEKIDLILDILSNKQTLSETTGLYTLYADDGTTVLKTAAAWEDVAGTIPYRGRGLARLDELQ